jgi:hypothetical protein
MCYGDVNQADPYKRAVPVPPVDDPVQIYTRLFGAVPQGTPAQMMAALKKRKSVLDFAISDYQSLQAKVGTGDRAKLDQHLTNIRDIEKSVTTLIANPPTTTCPGAATIMPMSPARQQCLRDQDLRTPAELAMQTPNFCVTNFPQIGQLQMDLMVLALTCDLTRVASLQWSTAESTVIHSWLADAGIPALQYAGTKEHHMMTHNETIDVSRMGSKITDQAIVNTIRADLSHVDTWYASRFAYLLGKLKAVQEANGKTLLDNMMLYWTTEVGLGGVHSYTNVPTVIAGGCQGELQTGRFIDYIPAMGPNGVNWSNVAVPFGTGPAHNKLFVSFMNKMGINENSFGFKGAAGEDPALWSGPLPAL